MRKSILISNAARLLLLPRQVERFLVFEDFMGPAPQDDLDTINNAAAFRHLAGIVDISFRLDDGHPQILFDAHHGLTKGLDRQRRQPFEGFVHKQKRWVQGPSP